MGRYRSTQCRPEALGEVLSWYARTTGAPDVDVDHAGTGPAEEADADSPPNGAADGEDDQPGGAVGARRQGDVLTLGADPGLTERLVTLLTDPAARLRRGQLLDAKRSLLTAPGLYSWWVDHAGAADLTAGTGLPVQPGLIYAGLAGRDLVAQRKAVRAQHAQDRHRGGDQGLCGARAGRYGRGGAGGVYVMAV